MPVSVHRVIYFSNKRRSVLIWTKIQKNKTPLRDMICEEQTRHEINEGVFQSNLFYQKTMEYLHKASGIHFLSFLNVGLVGKLIMSFIL